MKSKLVKVTAAVAGVAVLGTLTASYGFADPSPFATIRNFLIAWQVENFKVAAESTTGTDKKIVAAELRGVRQQLGAASLKLSLDGSRIVKSGSGYDARFTIRIDLGENGDPWVYQSMMHLTRVDGTWRIAWDPSVIHPQLGKGERFAVVTTLPTRKPILDTHGKSLLGSVNTVQAGVYPGELAAQGMTDSTLRALAKVTFMDPDRLIEQVQSAPPNEFLPLVMLLASSPRTMSDQLHAIPGVRFRQQDQTVQPLMADQLIGSLGTATPDQLQKVGAPYRPGDTIGVSGLEQIFQRQLASAPTVQIVVQDPNGQSPPRPLATWVPKDTPQAVQTTLDPTFQKKAEAALKGLKAPASLVALQPLGDVLAVANHGTEHNLAMIGQYPPGMTFGIVSAEALLSHGVQPTDKIDCVTGAAGLGQQRGGSGTFQANFGKTCGAATLQSLASRVDGQSLAQQAALFGIGKDLGLAPVPAYSGQAPVPTTDADKAAMMSGEGRVLVSPLTMALVASAVSKGVWQPPSLLKPLADPGGLNPGPPPAQQAAQLQPLDRESTFAVQNMMLQSVQSGAAKSAKVNGKTVRGVVSQVDYGQGKTVSWFVGYTDVVAFAIAIEGKYDAAKVAAAFLK